jgi:hypothetical protein
MHSSQQQVRTEPRYLRRQEVPIFLKEHLGVTIAKSTLDKMASLGEGPPFEYFGRIPVYRDDIVLAWGRSRISKRPVHLGANLMAREVVA